MADDPLICHPLNLFSITVSNFERPAEDLLHMLSINPSVSQHFAKEKKTLVLLSDSSNVYHLLSCCCFSFFG